MQRTETKRKLRDGLLGPNIKQQTDGARDAATNVPDLFADFNGITRDPGWAAIPTGAPGAAHSENKWINAGWWTPAIRLASIQMLPDRMRLGRRTPATPGLDRCCRNATY